MSTSTNRIDAMFESLKQEGRKALVLYITSGHPDLETTGAVLPALEEAGCDLIELGVPFSDPIADGPIIQKACTESLAGGTTLKKILALVRESRAGGLTTPLILFSALNPLYHYGLEKLAADAAGAGVDGFLVPDLPPEEAAEFKPICDALGLKLIFLVAPTSPEERKKAIAEQCTGFVYYISLKGITGARSDLAADIDDQVAQIKRGTSLPVCVGFGISKPEHVATLAAQSPDGLVVGSALVKLIGGAHAKGGASEAARAAAEFTRRMKAPLLK